LFALSNAQLITSFSAEHDRFLKELNQYMTESKMDNNIKAMDELQKMVKDGKLSSTWLDQMITTADLMIARRMSPAPHFYNYIKAVMDAVKSGKTDDQFDEWNTIAGHVIDDQKKGDNNNFLKFVEFSNGFFEQNALNSTTAKNWRVETTDYKFSYDNNKPAINFPTTTLIGSVKGDSVSIKQTSGTYYPLETKWIGKSGKVDWERAGFDPAKVYCTFKNYSINLSNFNYTVDSVTFYDLDYFKEPLTGKMSDKMVSSADSINMTYPRFESYNVGMTIKDLAPNVSYTGGFSLHGSKVLGYGNADAKAVLTFYARDGKTKILSCHAPNITIKKAQELAAEKAEVSIYFGTDSIYHPQLNLIYKIQKHEMRLLRGETGMGNAKFTDSYHNDEFQTDAIFWNLDSAVLNLKILSGVGKKPGVYESVNYFDKELLRKTQGVTSYEPLYVLKKICDKTGSRTVNVTEFARALDPNLKEPEVKSLLYDLVGSGFILYDEDLGVITVKAKAINYVLAKAKKIDYDIISVKSAPQSGNDYIDLKNSNIDLKGVFEVPISDSDYVYFRPRDNSISLQKDRNMEFDGLMYAGRMDMTGEKFRFEYLPFTVELTKVDTMRINVPDSNKVDRDGNPILKPMKSKVEGIKGLLEIDAPINKSGRTKLPQFPRLYSKEKSYIYYDDPKVAKGAYNRKNFFFELEPFRLDSLNNFSPDIINWQGKLVSGGIFPDVKDSVHMQKDESLGFKSETPKNGYDLYKGKGKYYGKYELNYEGLQGSGRITHSTADFTTDNVHLYPDSLRAMTDSFSITKTFDGVKTPKVTGDSDLVFWTPGNDSMYISMRSKNKPFAMYDDSFTTFKGSLLLTDNGLRGNGTLDWDLATLTSKDFSFQTMNLSADTAALNIKTTGDRVSFKTPNVSAKVDFKSRIGDFKSNLLNIPTEFSYNQYATAINEFKWYMDEKILDFKAPAQGPGEYFTSTRPDQKGLKFLGKRATYNLVSSVLRIEQVPEIKVADASVVPDSGVVVIEGEAKMHQLHNAVIYADTTNKFHRFDSATVDIYSKEELKAVGLYHYTTKDIHEVLEFGDISTKRETEGEHRKKTEVWKLIAKTNIDESKNFVIYPGVKFTGEGTIASIDTFINFKGYAKIDFKNPKTNTSEFFINQGVDSKKLALKYDTATKNTSNNKLSTGIHINPSPDAAAIYNTIMAPKLNNKDLTIFKTTGIATQLPSGEYLFGNEQKIKGNSQKGNVLKYDDKKGAIKAEGKFDLGAKFGLIKNTAAGTADVKLDSAKYKLNLTIGIDAQVGDKIQERLEFYLAGDDADQPELKYDNERQKTAVYALTDEKDDKKLLEDFNNTQTLGKRPKNFDYNLVFSDVNFVFDPDDISLRSVGKIGVALVGKKVINKKLEGTIEIQYKGGADAFTIYLQTGTKGWFYFEYRPGALGVLSSYDDINKLITSLTPDKRKIKGSNNRFYLYTAASSLSKDDFVDYMKDKASGVIRPRPQPRAPQEEIPVSGDTSSINDLPGDTTGNAAPEEQKPQPREDINQQEINQINQMKMNGGSILSGPPPDRLKPKEAPKQDTITSKQEIITPATPAGQDTVPVNQNQAPPKEEIKQPEPVPTPPVNQEAAPQQQAPPPSLPKQDTIPPVQPAIDSIPH